MSTSENEMLQKVKKKVPTQTKVEAIENSRNKKKLRDIMS